jgi:hypothetical protein
MRRSIEFVLIGPVLRSRAIRRVSRDRGQHRRKLRRHQLPHLYGGPKRRSAPPQLQRVSHHREGRSEASDARTPSTGLIQNLNPDFNVVCVQAIMETIQRMTPDSSPLALLAQQGAEAANLVVAEKSIGVPQREPSGGHNDRARRGRSEVASSFSPNRRLAGNDARRRITQNRNVWEYGRDRDDL